MLCKSMTRTRLIFEVPYTIIIEESRTTVVLVLVQVPTLRGHNCGESKAGWHSPVETLAGPPSLKRLSYHVCATPL